MPKTSIQTLLNKYPFTMSDHDLIYVPKSITLMSEMPVFDLQKQILKYIYEMMRRKERTNNEKSIRIPRKYINQLEEVIRDYEGTDQIDAEWDKTFSYDRTVYMKHYIKEEEFTIRESSLREFYISAIFSVLDLTRGPAERIVLKLIEDENEELLRYRVYQEVSSTNLPNVSFKYLFRRLSAANIIKLFKGILQEKQIIFFARAPGEIPYITEALLSLISPLTWGCVYIPNLPAELWETCHALMPYLIGLSSKYKKLVLSNIDVSDKLVVDLDKDEVMGTDPMEFPKKLHDYLFTKLEEISKVIKNMGRKKSDMILVDCTLKTRHYFHIFLLMLFNNYLKNFIIPENEEPNQKYPASEIFDFKKYIESLPKEFQIMNEIHKTMMFTTFIEESFELVYYCDVVMKKKWTDFKDEVSAFIRSLRELNNLNNEPLKTSTGFIDVLNPKALSLLDSINGPQIRNSTQMYFSPEKIDLFPYLVKYYYKLNKEKLNSSKKAGHHSRNTSLRQYNQKEVAVMNKQIQMFPKLNREKIMDLKNIFKSKVEIKPRPSVSDQTGLKFPIFSVYKDHVNLPESELGSIDQRDLVLPEDQGIQHSDQLRESNYFLYYQMVKRNSVIPINPVSDGSDRPGSIHKRSSEFTINVHHFHPGIEPLNVVNMSKTTQPDEEETKVIETNNWSHYPNKTPSGGKIQGYSLSETVKLSDSQQVRTGKVSTGGRDITVSGFELGVEIPKRPQQLNKNDLVKSVIQKVESDEFLKSNSPLIINKPRHSKGENLSSPGAQLQRRKLIFDDTTPPPPKSDPLQNKPGIKDIGRQRSLNLEIHSSLDNLKLLKYAKSTIHHPQIRTSLGDTDSSPHLSPTGDKKKIFDKKQYNTVSATGTMDGKENLKDPTLNKYHSHPSQVSGEFLIKNLDTGELMSLKDLEDENKKHKQVIFK